MINARAETLQKKVSFRRLLERRRCLILADSFFEWKAEEGVKKPVRFVMQDQQPFAFAGLWDRWNHDGEELVSCTVITTQPNELVKDVHNRMPVILKREHEQKWIDQEEKNLPFLNSMLTPFDARLMEAYEVSTAVNSPRNNDVNCITPI
jgi:putative SOS response-associated peptidase YedK